MKSSSKTRILVIEDDPAIRETLTDILEMNGFIVVSATDGREGVASARQVLPDVVLTDISMSGLDGFGVIAALRAEEATRAIPVIIISASIEPERVRRGMDLGAEDYIVKPFTEDQILRSIRARLEKKLLLDELDAFAHTVAHDLKNPISVLIGRADLLRLTWDTSDDATRLTHVAAIEMSARRLCNIVDELLVLAGVHRQSVKPQRLDMEAVVQEALARVEPMVRKTEAQIEQPAAWPVAYGHPPWIAEIWANYLSNALKYGGQPPRVQLGAAADGGRQCVRFWVQDNGRGLTAEQQEQLFQPFTRVTDTRAKGHGLGLSIVRRIAEKLGGRVGVDSQCGSGSRFWFELPAAPLVSASNPALPGSTH